MSEYLYHVQITQNVAQALVMVFCESDNFYFKTCICTLSLRIKHEYLIMDPQLKMKKTFSHYENTPMQDPAIFHGCKNDNFRLKFFDYIHRFAQNIDCWYTLEPPH